MQRTFYSRLDIKAAREQGVWAAAGDGEWSDNPYRGTDAEPLRKAWDDGYARPMMDPDAALADGIEDAGPPK